jgi:Transglycosylase SLT domain
MAKKAGAEIWLWVALGAAAAGYFIFANKEAIVSYGTDALAAGKELYFKLSIADDAQDYSDIILQVAREQGVDPFLIYALGERESRWGDALSPKGPGGTGDAGHGRGIMQIDDRSFGPDEQGIGSGDGWLAANDWRDPYTNVTKGAQVLNQALRFFQSNSAIKGYTDGRLVSITSSASRLGVTAGYYPDPRPLDGDALTAAALAAYNTGAANVLMALAAGKSPDTTTTGGNYAGDVIAKASAAAAAFQSQA